VGRLAQDRVSTTTCGVKRGIIGLGEKSRKVFEYKGLISWFLECRRCGAGSFLCICGSRLPDQVPTSAGGADAKPGCSPFLPRRTCRTLRINSSGKNGFSRKSVFVPRIVGSSTTSSA